MPGYVIHLATCSEVEMKNESFVKGVLAPDILHAWYRTTKSQEKLKEIYDNWKTPEMPDFFKLNARACSTTKQTLHYGHTSNPNLNSFICDTNVDISNPFWKGYFKHLLADLMLYQELKIEEKLEVTDDEAKTEKEKIKLFQLKRETLHNDWDILNKKISQDYQIILPQEVKELNIVSYKKGTLQYVDEHTIYNLIHMLRNFNLD